VRKAGYSSAIHDIVDRLFVYGTLRAGQHARSLIADHVVRAVDATTQGTLVGFDDYPGLLDDGGTTVIGELVWLSDLAAAFALLDAYEGDDFIRVLKKVRVAEADEWAWCYLLADPRMAADGQRIDSGDWVRWRDAVRQFTK
jgi:gamma-glutamylcyclotransferase (GGCT)/AIG2-like uncharacterized protein YtfP